jgi:hypothetical protein
MGAPVGNQNAAKAKIWAAAIERALERRVPGDQRIRAIDELADKFLDSCEKGQIAAFKELADRLDGKAEQPVAVSAPGGGPMELLVRGAEELRAKIRGQ